MYMRINVQFGQPLERGDSMEFALCGLSALSVLRELRRRGVLDVANAKRVNLSAPILAETGRKSRAAMVRFLEGYPCVAGFSSERPLQIAVPSAKDRPRIKAVSCTVHSGGLPEGAFMGIGDGLTMSSPELLFVELANVMSPEVHLLLGMELCGTFARDPVDPRNGAVAYQVPAVTSVQRLRAFVEACWHVNGLGKARETLEWLVDNAWSPMEAILTALSVLPGAMLGYDLWPVQLNRRIDMEEGASKQSRVPDLLFCGTEVGMNYDGEDHLPLRDIASAAMRLALSPGSSDKQKELENAIAVARAESVSDKRRDRDLGAAGMTVFAVTKEDLYEERGLDKLMLQVIEAIERGGRRKLTKQRVMLENPLLASLRQEFIWSLLPGKTGMEAGRRLKERLEPKGHPVMHTATYADGHFIEHEMRELGLDEVYI